MADIGLVQYTNKYEERWDRFVLSQSINGTILQTRKFLNYHPIDRFEDNSLIIMKGTEIIGVIPAIIEKKEGLKRLVSHKGSTFGGIIIGKNNIKVSVLEKIFEELDEYCNLNSIKEITLKMTSELYSKGKSELLYYFLFNHGYKSSLEVGYFIDFKNYNSDIISNYSSSVRRHYKTSMKNNLVFKELDDREGIKSFYEVLLDNYKKFDSHPAHSLEDLYLLKEKILRDEIHFFVVFKDDEAVASSMVFDFDHKVFHTQYLASKSSYSSHYVNEFLYTNLIKSAMDNNYPYISFGTATLEGGIVLNYNLAQYKEQYGTNQYVNVTYTKSFDGRIIG